MIFLFYFYFLNLFLLFCCFLTLLFCCWFTSLPGPVLSVLSDVKLGFSSWPVLRVRHASISAYNYFRVISRNLTQPDGEWYHLAATVSCFATPAQNTNRGLFCCICSQFLSSFQVSVGWFDPHQEEGFCRATHHSAPPPSPPSLDDHYRYCSACGWVSYHSVHMCVCDVHVFMYMYICVWLCVRLDSCTCLRVSVHAELCAISLAACMSISSLCGVHLFPLFYLRCGNSYT